MKKRSSDILKEARRELRNEMTEAEKILWNELRDRRFEKTKFRRQHPFIGRFVLDFFCAEKKLAIELDGFVHDGKEEIDKDRQSIIEAHGIRMIRFRNEEVRYNLGGVLEKIMEALNEKPSP